jgi:hypothetical protein
MWFCRNQPAPKSATISRADPAPRRASRSDAAEPPTLGASTARRAWCSAPSSTSPDYRHRKPLRLRIGTRERGTDSARRVIPCVLVKSATLWPTKEGCTPPLKAASTTRVGLARQDSKGRVHGMPVNRRLRSPVSSSRSYDRPPPDSAPMSGWWWRSLAGRFRRDPALDLGSDA